MHMYMLYRECPGHSVNIFLHKLHFLYLYVKWHCELLRFFDDGQLKAQRLIRKILIVAKPKFKQHQF